MSPLLNGFTVTPHQAIELGWSIIPIRIVRAQDGFKKFPMVTGWKEYQNRQTTIQELETWLRKFNPQSWAMITGSQSRRITLDFDGAHGTETMRALQISPHRSTLSGGFHADFEHPGWRVPTRSGIDKRWPGVDSRGDGGYAVFAGGVDDRRYVWLRKPTPNPFNILPDELQAFLRRTSADASLAPPTATPYANGGTGGLAAGEFIRLALSRIASHGRNESGFWLAAQLRDNGWNQSGAHDALKSYRAQCPPTNRKGEIEEYTETEMLASVDQVYSRAPRAPWDTGKKREPPPDQNEREKDAPDEDAPGGDEAPKRNKHFLVTPHAVYYVDEETRAKTFVSSTLRVEAYARDQNSDSWGRLLKWRDRAGKEHSWIVPMRMLVGDGVDVRATLADGGLDIGTSPKTNHLLAQYIRTERPSRSMYCVPHVGWFDRAFVFPDSVIPAGAEVGYQSAGRGEHFYRTKGTLESWRQQVSEKCAGNSRLVFAVSAAFAGPLLRLLNVGGGGFHFRGTSSIGKSTTQWAAGSVYGGGGRSGFARTWSATKSAIESIAELHNDGCLILDEIRQIDPREVEQIVYTLANGSGKSRETRNLTGRRTLQWLCMILSSGEIQLSDCAALAGQKIKGGAEIRMATIPADAGKGMGIFEELHGAHDARVFAETLEAAAKENYGTAILAYLERLAANWETVHQEGREFIEDFIAGSTISRTTGDKQPILPAAAAPEVRRVLRRFAVVACAGEIATEAGITGWKKGAATQAAIACFKAWLRERGGVDATDTRNAIRQVREIIGAHQGRFYAAEPQKTTRENGEEQIIREHINNALGYWKEINGETVYLVNPEAFKNELCRSFDHIEVAKDLHKRGMLLKNQSDRWLYKTDVMLPTGAKERLPFYAVTAKILRDEESEEGK